jgi:hypothetical protein
LYSSPRGGLKEREKISDAVATRDEDRPVRRARTGLLLLTMSVLTAFAVPQGVVLCVGSDGHVAVEGALEIRPCSVPLRDSGAPDGVLPGEDCVDTPIAPPLLLASSERDVPAPLMSALPVPPLASARARRQGCIRDVLDVSSAQVRALRTVVLRV